MNRVVNYLRGTARVRVTGQFPERAVNLYARNGVEFWAVEWTDETTVALTVRRQGLADARVLAEKAQCVLETDSERGLPGILHLFRRRYGFLIGLTAALLSAAVLSGFVMTIEVTGNDRVSEKVILQQLQRFGLRPGVYGPSLDRRQIEQEVLLSVEDLAWMTINLHGTRVEVQVFERKEAPKQIDEREFYHVVSRADGIISKVEAELGDAKVRTGDTVAKGDILISGTVTLEPPKYSDLPERYYNLHARGHVWARTWREMTAIIPVETAVKVFTGRENIIAAINFFGTRVEFFGNSSISTQVCDKITSVCPVEFPMGLKLPFWLVLERYREYETEHVLIQKDTAADMLKKELAKQLDNVVGKDGQVLHTSYETRVTDDHIFVRVVGECLEEIGREVRADSTE
jgi:similar to stage IV sporulation protein